MTADILTDLCRKEMWDDAKALIAENPRLLLSEEKTSFPPARWAAYYDNVEMLQYMYDALMKLPGPHEQMLQYTFERGNKERYLTPVHSASSRGRINVLEFLVKHAPSGTAILEAKDSEGSTAAHIAASNSHLDVLEFLVKHAPSDPAILEARDVNGGTPAHRAARWSSVEVLEFLLRNSPSGVEILKIKDHRGLTPLDLISQRIVSEHFTPQKIREIGLKREMDLIRNSGPSNPFVSLVFSIIEENCTLAIKDTNE